MAAMWTVEWIAALAGPLLAGVAAPATQPLVRTITLGGWITLVTAWLILGGGLIFGIWIAAHHRVVGSGTTETETRSGTRGS